MATREEAKKVAEKLVSTYIRCENPVCHGLSIAHDPQFGGTYIILSVLPGSTYNFPSEQDGIVIKIRYCEMARAY